MSVSRWHTARGGTSLSSTRIWLSRGPVCGEAECSKKIHATPHSQLYNKLRASRESRAKGAHLVDDEAPPRTALALALPLQELRGGHKLARARVERASALSRASRVPTGTGSPVAASVTRSRWAGVSAPGRRGRSKPSLASRAPPAPAPATRPDRSRAAVGRRQGALW